MDALLACAHFQSVVCIFQRKMENLLRTVPSTAAFQDDVLVTGRSARGYLQNLNKVLNCLSSAGLRLPHEKCALVAPEVEHLGHRITCTGISPSPGKVEAIKNAPAPTKCV